MIQSKNPDENEKKLEKLDISPDSPGELATPNSNSSKLENLSQQNSPQNTDSSKSKSSSQKSNNKNQQGLPLWLTQAVSYGFALYIGILGVNLLVDNKPENDTTGFMFLGGGAAFLGIRIQNQ